MKVTANFDKRLLNVTGIMGNIKADISRSLIQSGVIVKTSLVQELKAVTSKKRGVVNKRNRYGGRRSAPGQSLANDTGKTLELIESSKSTNSIEVGIRTNNQGMDYVAYWEANGRPTMELAIKKSRSKIEKIFEKNLTPK